MKGLFGVDSPIYRFMSTLLNVIILNFCWIIGSLPIVTIGVSTVAACDVGLMMVDNEEGYVAKQFFRAYKKNIKQGIPLGIITLVAAYVIYLDFQIVNAMGGSIPLIMVGVLSIIVFATGLVYSYPMAAHYENRLPNIMKNSFRISTRYFIRTAGLLIGIALLVFAFLWNTTMIFIGILIGPAAVILLICLVSKPIFKKIEKTNEEAEEE